MLFATKRPWIVLGVFLGAVSAAGCGGMMTPTDGSTGDTGGTVTDTGGGGDTGPRTDSGTTDTGPRDVIMTDTPTGDTGTPGDGAVPTDTGTSDVAAPIDGGTDVLAPIDTGTPDDVAVTDTGTSPTDAQPLGDGGTCPMTGTLALDDMKTATIAPASGSTAGCMAALNGDEHNYTLVVATQQKLTLTTGNSPEISPGNLPDTIMTVRRVCDDSSPASQVACDDDTGPDLSALARVDLAPGTYTVTVDTFETSADYVLRSVTPAAHSECAMARTLTPGTPISAEDSLRGFNLPTACDTFLSGSQLFYSLTIPANQRGTITATPTSTLPAWHPVIRLVDTCASATCLTSVEADSDGEPAVAVFDNNSNAPRTVIVSVGSDNEATYGTFDLTATVAPPPTPYTKTTIAASCDTLTAATTLTFANLDDSVSPVTALPNPLTFYGTSMTHFAASTNGFVYLVPSMTSSVGTSVAGNDSIPLASPMGNVVAAFWDDLVGVAGQDGGMGSSIRTQSFTAGQPHFVIEYTTVHLFDDQAANLTFQIKFFNNTNVIEFHYCSLTPGTMTGLETGSSATIGLDNNGDTSGVQHSFDTAGGATTGSAIRWTP